MHDRLTVEVLRAMPLPPIEGGKETRGRVLLVGGGRQVAGAVKLAGEGALRAGAGKLRIASARSVCAGLGLSVPEARVYGLAETPDGEIAAEAAEAIVAHARQCDAVLIGPGMIDADNAQELALRLLDGLPASEGPAVVIDAVAMMGLWSNPEFLRRRGGRAVITPHHGEMAGLCGKDVCEVEADPAASAWAAAEHLRCSVALKSRQTFIASPDGRVIEHRHACDGLGTAGSGDVLAGIIAGLVARGAHPLTATAWGVAAHARAGERLGPPGFLARDIAGQVPEALRELAG